VGDTFQGTERFKILRRLGHGGTGIVYLAHDTLRGIDVALKTLHQESPYGILRLKNEFRGLAELSHLNLVDLHGLHHEAKTWFFTMEYVDGVDFLEWVRPFSLVSGEFELDLLRLRNAFEQLAEGLVALHASGHLHRDIKPSNMLVERDGRVVILDFGLATKLDQIDVRDIRGFSGTLEYMAPEQSDGSDPLSASDWYSFGVVLFQALTGELPFQGKPLQVAVMKKQNDGPPPSKLNRRVPADLDALCKSLLKRDPAERATESDVLNILGIELEESTIMTTSSTSLTAMPRLIGRESHLGALVSAFSEIKKDKSVVCSVHGRSGMGKSALIKYFLEPLKSREDVMILEGRCYEREAVPYKAFDRVFDDLTRQLNCLSSSIVKELTPPGIGALTHLFPVLLNVPSIAKSVRSDTLIIELTETRQVAFQAARDLFSRLANRWSLALHIDDVHWGDDDSVALLRELLDLPDAPNMLVLCSFHTESIRGSNFVRFLRLMLARQADGFDGREIEVGPLDDTQAMNLTRYLLREINLGQHHLEQIVRESHGNPFFVESLTRHITEFNEDRRKSGGLKTGAMTLDALVGSRITSIDVNSRRLLHVVAVAAKPLLRSHAIEIAGLGAESERCISELRASHLLRTKTSDNQVFLEVYHDRLRAPVLDGISKERATQINLDIALCLERGSEREPAALVDHFVHAGDFDKARQYTAESARMADNKLAFEHAATLYDQALSIHRQSVTIPASDDAVEEEIELLMALGQALSNSGRTHQSAKIFVEAATKADDSLRNELRMKACINLILSGSLEQGLDLLGDILGELNIPFPLSSQEALPSLGKTRKAIEERGYSTHMRLDIPEETVEAQYIDACWTAAVSLGMIDYVRAADFQARGLLKALEFGDPYRLARSLGLQSMYTGASGPNEIDAALDVANRAMTLAETVDKPHALGLAHYGRGVGLLLTGRWAEAQEALEYAADVFRESCQDAAWERSTTHVMLFSAMAMRGDFKPIVSRVPELLEWAKDRGNEFFATSMRTGYPSLAWLCGDDPDTAERNRSDAIQRWSHDDYQIQQYFGLMTQVHLCLYKGDFELALEHVADAWVPLRRAMIDQIHFVKSDLLSLRVRASLAALTTSKRVPELSERIERDLERLKENPAQWVRAQSCLFQACLNEYLGHEDAAKIGYANAIDALATADLGGYLAAAKIRYGSLLGGDEGRQWLDAGIDQFKMQGVRKPSLMTRLYAPGYTD